MEAAFGVPGEVIFVDAEAVGANDGCSWGDAFVDLQDALAAAHARPADEPVEIWIAGGVYRPAAQPGDRKTTFLINRSLTLRGGFCGFEGSEAGRGGCETVLSGDLAGNDDWLHVGESNCCRPDESRPNCEDEACSRAVWVYDWDLYGCTIGWTRECAHRAQFSCQDLCRPTRIDNAENIVTLAATATAVVLDGLTFEGGQEQLPQDEFDISAGSAVYATYFSGGIEVRDCLFQQNAADGGSALYFTRVSATASMRDCTFRDNYDFGGGTVLFGGEHISIDHCVFQKNAGVGPMLSNSVITNTRFLDHQSVALIVRGDQEWIENCDFVNNRNPGGGIGSSVGALSAQGPTVVVNSRFIGNHAASGGGAIDSSIVDPLLVINSLFLDNHADGWTRYPGDPTWPGIGGAIQGDNVEIRNSTFVGNSANEIGGAAVGSGNRVFSSVFWNNWDDTGVTREAQLSMFPDLRYSDVQGLTGPIPNSRGNIGQDPMFVDVDGPDDVFGTPDDDLRPGPGSPLINGGHPSAPGLPSYDLDLRPRVMCGRVDIGAYEHGFGDANCDGAVDVEDAFVAMPCLTGANIPTKLPACAVLDSDGDGDMDLVDLGAILALVAR